MHKDISIHTGAANLAALGSLTEAVPLDHYAFKPITLKTSFGSVTVVGRVPAEDEEVWNYGLKHLATDHRYFNISHSSLGGQFQHLYLVLKDQGKKTRAVQPFLFVRQDIMAGLPVTIRDVVDRIRRSAPTAFQLPMMMVGCSAGEGHLTKDIVTEGYDWVGNALRESIEPVAKRMGAWMIVLKDFPRTYRNQLEQLRKHGYERIPSMPGAKLALDFKTFDEYLSKKLSHKTRKNLRQKYREAAVGEPMTMEVTSDISPIISELYPLYLQVLSRSKMKFEELTPRYFCDLGRLMPEKSLFFTWKQGEKYVAFCSCIVHEGVLRDNYIGLDYKVAFDYHLYYVTWRDMVNWALKNNIHTYYSAPLNYEPKYHLRMDLAPLDLYVKTPWRLVNPLCRLAVRYALEPTKSDKSIRKFANAHELW